MIPLMSFLKGAGPHKCPVMMHGPARCANSRRQRVLTYRRCHRTADVRLDFTTSNIRGDPYCLGVPGSAASLNRSFNYSCTRTQVRTLTSSQQLDQSAV